MTSLMWTARKNPHHEESELLLKAGDDIEAKDNKKLYKAKAYWKLNDAT